ncbi:hypothetical protein Tco_0116408, partial [Tanacetum coccineum]
EDILLGRRNLFINQKPLLEENWEAEDEQFRLWLVYDTLDEHNYGRVQAKSVQMYDDTQVGKIIEQGKVTDPQSGIFDRERQLPTESVFEAWERFKSCLRKCPDHRILLNDQILRFYHGITMIDQDKIMVAAGGNIMRKTPQEAYDLIENITQHHYQWDSEFQYDTTTDMSAHYSKTTFASSEQVECGKLEEG